jgi:hypothetical protein
MTPALRSLVIGPVLARLRSFLLRDFVKQSTGHPKSSFDMATVLDGGVLLARLPKGALGEETARSRQRNGLDSIGSDGAATTRS